MRSVLLSIRPQWCEEIFSGRKTVEVRKTRPNLELPFKCYVYCTKHGFKSIFLSKFLSHNGQVLHGRVIGEFICDAITRLENVATDPWDRLYGSVHDRQKKLVTECALLTEDQLIEYAGGKVCYGWHISDLKLYDKPRRLTSLLREGDCQCIPKGGLKCPYYDRGTPGVIEDDCVAPFNTTEFEPILRPPQSWCYVDEEVDDVD